MKKKVFTLVITLALILSMIPVSAFAADGANGTRIWVTVSGDLDSKLLSDVECTYESGSFAFEKEGQISFEIKKENHFLKSVQIYSGPESSFWDGCTTLEGEFFPDDEGIVIATINLEKGKNYAVKYELGKGKPLFYSGDVKLKLLSGENCKHYPESGTLNVTAPDSIVFTLQAKNSEWLIKKVRIYSKRTSSESTYSTLEGEFLPDENGIVTVSFDVKGNKDSYIIQPEFIDIPIIYSGDIGVFVKSGVPCTNNGCIEAYREGKINLSVKSNCNLYLKKVKVYSGIFPSGSKLKDCEYTTLEGEFPVDSTGTANVQLDLVDGRAYTIEEELQDDPVSGTVQQELTKLKPVVSTSKTSKGIKVTYKAKTGSISKIKKYGGKVQYKIYRATQKNGKYTLKKTTTSSSYTDTSVKKGKKYYYKVRVYVKDADGRLIGSTALSKSNAGSRVYK